MPKKAAVKAPPATAPKKPSEARPGLQAGMQAAIEAAKTALTPPNVRKGDGLELPGEVILSLVRGDDVPNEEDVAHFPDIDDVTETIRFELRLSKFTTVHAGARALLTTNIKATFPQNIMAFFTPAVNLGHDKGLSFGPTYFNSGEELLVPAQNHGRRHIQLDDGELLGFVWMCKMLPVVVSVVKTR